MTAAATEESMSTAQFAAVAGLGPHGEEAARKLGTVHEELNRRGAPGDAQRLLAAERAAEDKDFDALERLAAKEYPLDELSEHEHRRVRRIVSLRNASALLPLVITWALLGWASMNYQNQLATNRALASEPFLALWQNRFGGEWIPTFSETAGTTVSLILLILLLTMWSHRRETRSAQLISGVAARLDEAMDALARAADTSTIRPPVTAQEWAETAQEVLTRTQEALLATQEAIGAAVAETKELSAENRRITADAHKEMEELQTQAKNLVAGLANEVRETLAAIREDNTQFIARTAKEAIGVLQQAVTDNRQLVEDHMTPLFEGFRESLKDYQADHQVYRTSASALAESVTELTASAAVLAGSAKSHAEVASSIDKHLELIEGSQSQFVAKVAEHSEGIGTASGALEKVAELLDGRVRGELETLAKDVVAAGTRIAEVDRSLAETSSALATTTGAMRTAAAELATATRSGKAGRRLFSWLRRSRTGAGS